MTKFKVGDKAEIIEKPYNRKQVGEVVEIAEVRDSYIVTTDGFKIIKRKLRLTDKAISKPTKNQRITALEEKVAELQAQLDELKQPQFLAGVDWANDKDVMKVSPLLTNNQKRAAIIERAKLELAEQLPWWNAYQNEFVINTEKRTVVLLRKDLETGKVNIRGIAKCHPNDVFNEHLGKIIAFGRATGYPTEEFRQAVQPDEVVVGMGTNLGEVKAVRPTHRESTGQEFSNYKNGFTIHNQFETWFPLDWANITNDTNAEYLS